MSTDAANQTARSLRARLGMWVFIASEMMFFSPVVLGYLVGRYHHPAAFASAGARTDLLWGSINTAVLLSSSLAMAIAVEAGKAGMLRWARYALGATALLGIVFLLIKGMEYHHEWQEGLVPGRDFHLPESPDPAASQNFYVTYFIGTGLHAVHLVIGIVLVSTIQLKTWQRSGSVPRHLHVVGLYWHFVDVVWIFLFPAFYLLGRT